MERKENVQLRLLTMNTLGVPFMRHTRARLATLGRELNETALDVICFQEIQFSRYIPLVQEAFPNFPHHAFEPFVHAPKGGLMTLSRLALRNQRFVLYEKRGRIASPALADWVLHKGILVAECAVQDVPVAVVNTHLVANYSADWSQDNRYARHQQAELEQLRQTLAEIPPEFLVVVVGDFNIPTGTRLYRDFVRVAGLYDPLAQSTAPTFRPPRFLPGRHEQALDHVLVRAPRGARVQASARIVFRDKMRLINGKHAHLSDHCAIEATLNVTCEK